VFIMFSSSNPPSTSSHQRQNSMRVRAATSNVDTGTENRWQRTPNTNQHVYTDNDVFNITARPQGLGHQLMMNSAHERNNSVWLERSNNHNYHLRNERQFVHCVPPVYSGAGQTWSSLRPLDGFTGQTMSSLRPLDGFTGQTRSSLRPLDGFTGQTRSVLRPLDRLTGYQRQHDDDESMSGQTVDL